MGKPFLKRIFLALLVANLNYSISVYEKGEFYMEFLIVRGLSSILEAGLWTYFIVSVSKIISKEEINFSKKQIILFFISLIFLTELRLFNKRSFSIS